ncbi:MAG TPA: hypothetical protein VGL28_06665 [Steroidobacteraceae bacterium]|jgi:hypothetical protein
MRPTRIRPKAQALKITPRLLVMLAAALSALMFALLAMVARSETVSVNDQVMVRESDVARPSRGMTMQSVEHKFGVPQQRHEAVGEPPISRWDYQGFSVFFEKDRVIHAVVTDSGTAASN